MEKDMISIPAGTFSRGSNESPDEQPIQIIEMSAFLIDKYPVSNKEYRRFILSGGYHNKKFWSKNGWKHITQNNITEPCYWESKNWNQDDQPVTGISFFEAQAYAKFMNKKLPTEAQWEYTAKGSDNRKYPWGDIEPTVEGYANFAPDCEPAELNRSSVNIYEHPKNISFFGCVQMGGNLAEWCIDNPSLNYEWDITMVDPVNLIDELGDRIVRGGSGLHDENYMRCSARDSYPPSVRDNIVGIRCVK